MAKTVAEVFADCSVNTKLYDLKESHNSEIINEVLTARYLAVGSPTLNNNMLPTVASFLTYLKGLAPKTGRKALAFGSYGWGGQSIAQVEEELKNAGFTIGAPMCRVQYIPNQEQLDALADEVKKMAGRE